MDQKLNLNKSPAYKDALIAAAKLSPGEMFRYFYFILAFLGAVLATDVNFCIRWWCFFLSPTWLDFYFVRWPWFISLNYRNWLQVCLSLLRSSFLLIVHEVVTPAEALQVRTADSTSELDLSAITQFSSDQERPSVFLSENLLFREAGWILPSIKQEMRVVLYVSWKHVTAFLWIMQHASNYCREMIYPMCISRILLATYNL